MKIRYIDNLEKTDHGSDSSFIEESIEDTQIELTKILNEYDPDGRVFDAWIANGGTHETFIAEYAS